MSVFHTAYPLRVIFRVETATEPIKDIPFGGGAENNPGLSAWFTAKTINMMLLNNVAVSRLHTWDAFRIYTAQNKDHELNLKPCTEKKNHIKLKTIN